MVKTPITWIELIKLHIKAQKNAGKTSVGVKDVVNDAKKEWVTIKEGNHNKYIKGTSSGTYKKSKSSKKSKTAKKSKSFKKSKSSKNAESDNAESDNEEPEPGHKGSPSKMRPGHIDFRTHKGDKYYNRDGHRQTTNREGKKGKPYSGSKTKKKTKKTKKTKKNSECKKCTELQKQIDAMQKEITELKEKTIVNEVL